MLPLTPRVEIRMLDLRLRTWGLPRYQTEMAAAVDLFACLEESLSIGPGSAAVLIRSGIAVHIADPHIAAMILPRSGLGHRNGLVLGNLVGLIDADYRDEIMISVWNRSPAGSPPLTVSPGDRIAQMLFVPVVRPVLTLVDEFTHGSGRSGGFGSTGTGSGVTP